MASTCTRCGTTSDEDGSGEGLPPGWSLSGSGPGADRLCGACTREHVRDIEAKLEEAWWSSDRRRPARDLQWRDTGSGRP